MALLRRFPAIHATICQAVDGTRRWAGRHFVSTLAGRGGFGPTPQNLVHVPELPKSVGVVFVEHQRSFRCVERFLDLSGLEVGPAQVEVSRGGQRVQHECGLQDFDCGFRFIQRIQNDAQCMERAAEGGCLQADFLEQGSRFFPPSIVDSLDCPVEKQIRLLDGLFKTSVRFDLEPPF